MAFIQFVQAQTVPVQPLVITLNTNNKAQTIENIGASGCWYSEGIGRYWPEEKKQHIAELLFSRKPDSAGNPRGIGLSAWRFNIGGGTAEQGAASGIKDPNHRVECFLQPDGTYDWSRQPGYQWFLRKAQEYGVEELIAFTNTPPVQFTLNGLGYKTEKDGTANLRPEKYGAYADFLTEVLKHFDQQGLHFSYVSPVNEPQWDWTGKPGEAKQEGSPWTNKEIYRAVRLLDSSLHAKKLQTKILAAEAGMLTYLYTGNTASSRQIQHFFSDTASLSFKKFTAVPRLVAAHSYFTDANDSNLVAIRRSVADTAAKYGTAFWQSEYSMLGNGYKEGSKERRTQMDCALFLAKVIHTDLAVAGATAWQLWNAYEPGRPDFDTRYYLIALAPDSGFVNGSYTPTKNLWALGHYSLFVRPGMQRLRIARSDNMGDVEAAQKTMVSAYTDGKGKTVIIAINYTGYEQPLVVNMDNKKILSVKTYTTTAAPQDNMRAGNLKELKSGLVLPARSITTLVITGG